MPETPETLLFDMYGTLCDPHAVTEALKEQVDAPDPLVTEMARQWREEQQSYMFRTALMDAYRPLSEVTLSALERTLDYYGHDVDEVDTDALMDAYEHLDLFEDTLNTLSSLEDAGVELAVFSNGSPEMLERLAANTGVKAHVDDVVSADGAETYKPHPVAYEYAADRFDRELEECWLVSSNTWDVVGASTAGMGAAWVDRHNEPYDPLEGGEPTVTVDSLSDLPSEL